jgi:hypothetical protein
MHSKLPRLLLAVSIATIALPFLSAIPVLAQNPDPLVGTWNLFVGGSSPYTLVQNFNAGGTTVEFDSAGTNPSGSPGESISLGTWAKTATNKYTFKTENYIYDQSGNLTLVAIPRCKLNLAADRKSVSGPCTIRFFACSITQCPGALTAGPIEYSFHGKRF